MLCSVIVEKQNDVVHHMICEFTFMRISHFLYASIAPKLSPGVREVLKTNIKKE